MKATDRHNAAAHRHAMSEGDGRQQERQTNTDNTKDAATTSLKRPHSALSSPPLSYPGCSLYERSFPHRLALTHVISSTNAQALITASRDGIVKTWKYLPVQDDATRSSTAADSSSVDCSTAAARLEYVKQVKAHAGCVLAMALSVDGLTAASLGVDNSIKVYSLSDLEVLQSIQLPFPCLAIALVHAANERPRLAATSRVDGEIRIIKVEGNDDGDVSHVMRFHSAPVHLIRIHPRSRCGLSADLQGGIDLWDSSEYQQYPIEGMKSSFTSKLNTDLFSLTRDSTYAISVDFSGDGKFFALLTAPPALTLKLFRTSNARIVHSVDLAIASPFIKSFDSSHPLFPYEALDFGRRLALEKAYHEQITQYFTHIQQEKPKDLHPISLPSVCFTPDNKHILFSCLLGVCVQNLATLSVDAIVGRLENAHRFTQIQLFQGILHEDTQLHSATALQGSELLQSRQAARGLRLSDPIMTALAYRSERAFVFTNRQPPTDVDRDAPADKPPGLALSIKAPSRPAVRPEFERFVPLNSIEAIMRTTSGDIKVKLFPQLCPRTVENFVCLSLSGVYNHCIFHRVIKGFMAQTGDYDGQGGRSIWGNEFEDECNQALNFAKPGMLAMANAGPCTNGSQFFLTTGACSWLDGKHTIFGELTSGSEALKEIEMAKTDKQDKPIERISIVNIEIVEP